MRRIVNQTKTPVYDANGRLIGHQIDTDTIEVPDPTPTPAAVRALTTHAQACAQCHQTACRCVEDCMPLSIMNARATVTNPAAMRPILNEYGYMEARQPASIPVQDTARPAPRVHTQAADAWDAYMRSPEYHALRTQEAQWEDLYSKCTSYLTCLVPDTQLRNCTAQQLAALYGQLQSGLVVREWRNASLEAWMPKGLLDHYPSKP